MLTCRICGCNCDPGDLKNGVCDDCRKEKRKEEHRKQETERLMRADYKQLEMEEFLR